MRPMQIGLLSLIAVVALSQPCLAQGSTAPAPSASPAKPHSYPSRREQHRQARQNLRNKISTGRPRPVRSLRDKILGRNKNPKVGSGAATSNPGSANPATSGH